MKIQVSNYTFDKVAKQVTFTDYSGPGIRLDRILLVADTTNNTLIYNFADPTKGGSVSGNVLTLTLNTNTVAFNNADSLLIFYEDGNTSQTVTGTITANAGTNLNTSALALESGNIATVASAVRAEDAASADAHTGIGALAVRKSSPANTSGTDGDYEFLQINAGRLWVSATIDAALPTGTNTIGKLAGNSGTVIGDVNVVNSNVSANVAQIAGNTTSTVASGVQKVAIADATGTAFVSAAHALNSTGAGLPVSQLVAEFDDTSPTTITENQFGNLRISSNRNLYGTIRDAAGNERGANVTAGFALVVDGSAVNQPVVGNIASGSADSGNPVKVGGKVNTSNPTLSDAQRSDLSLTDKAFLRVTLADLLAGEDVTNDVLKTEQQFSYQAISTATTTTVKSGAGFLHRLIITGGTTGTIIVYDNTAGSGTKILDYDTTNALASHEINAKFATGLTIVTSAATKVTAIYR